MSLVSRRDNRFVGASQNRIRPEAEVREILSGPPSTVRSTTNAGTDNLQGGSAGLTAI